MLNLVHVRRLNFAIKFTDFGTNWQTVLFSDEKKFNLDGHGGFKYYSKDLRTAYKFYSKLISGGGLIMVWVAIGYCGKTKIAFMSGRLNYLKISKFD